MNQDDTTTTDSIELGDWVRWFNDKGAALTGRVQGYKTPEIIMVVPKDKQRAKQVELAQALKIDPPEEIPLVEAEEVDDPDFEVVEEEPHQVVEPSSETAIATVQDANTMIGPAGLVPNVSYEQALEHYNHGLDLAIAKASVLMRILDSKENKKRLIAMIPKKNKDGKVIGHEAFPKSEIWSTLAGFDAMRPARVKLRDRRENEPLDDYLSSVQRSKPQPIWTDEYPESKGKVYGYALDACYEDELGREFYHSVVQCDRSEHRWKDKPNHALLGQVQTRAIGRCGRMGWSQVLVLAGVNPTPAEGIDSRDMIGSLYDGAGDGEGDGPDPHDVTHTCPNVRDSGETCGNELIFYRKDQQWQCWRSKGGCEATFTDGQLAEAEKLLAEHQARLAKMPDELDRPAPEPEPEQGPPPGHPAAVTPPPATTQADQAPPKAAQAAPTVTNEPSFHRMTRDQGKELKMLCTGLQLKPGLEQTPEGWRIWLDPELWMRGFGVAQEKPGAWMMLKELSHQNCDRLMAAMKAMIEERCTAEDERRAKADDDEVPF